MFGKKKTNADNESQIIDDVESMELTGSLELTEYFAHIYILETANINTADAVSCIIKASLMGETKYTKVIKNIGPGSQIFWGEHLFFQKQFTNHDELDSATFNISVCNYSALFKNTEIGHTSGSLSDIYGLKNHTKPAEWAILTNPQINYKEPMGFIRFAINFSRSKDSKPNLEALCANDKSSSITKMSIPPNIKLKEKQMLIRIFRGDRIVSMDSNGLADPYIVFDFGGLNIKTDCKRETLKPLFYLNVYIPTIYPTITNTLTITFKDYERFSYDDYIGTSNITLADINQGLYKEPMWVYFYGAHTTAKNTKLRDQMDLNPSIASHFKGALKLSIELQELTETKFGIVSFCKDEVHSENNFSISMGLIAEIEYIQNYKPEYYNCKVCVNWGGKRIFTKEHKSKNGVILIFERLHMSEEFGLKQQKLGDIAQICDELPDIIISVVEKNNHISFYRFRPENVLLNRTNADDPIVIELSADQSVSDLGQEDAGIMRLKLYIDSLSNINSRMPSLNPMPKTPFFEDILIICNVYQAKDLMPSDPDGATDAMVKLYHLGTLAQSSVFSNSLDPSWNERLFLKSTIINGSLAPIVIKIFDQDLGLLGDISYEFTGSAIISLNDAIPLDTTDLAEAKMIKRWYQLTIDGTIKTGKIMLSFAYMKQPLLNLFNYKSLGHIEIPKTLYNIKISILGLRDLQSTGILPVRSAEIKINTSSLKDVDTMQNGSAFSELSTLSQNGGSNPTIGTVLNISAYLPINILSMPSISCKVIDKGISFLKMDSIIGTFHINIGAFYYVSVSIVMMKLKNLEIKLNNDDNNVDYNPECKFRLVNLISKCENIIEEAESFIKNENSKFWRIAEKQTTCFTQEKHILGKDNNKKPENDQIQYENFDFIKGSKKSIEDEFNDDVYRTRENNVKDVDSNIFEPIHDKFNTLFNNNKTQIIIFPEYHKVSKDGYKYEEEKEIPNRQLYYGLGFKSRTKNTKHYRKILEKGLEDTEYTGNDLYSTINIFRGTKLPESNSSFFKRLWGGEESYKQMGSFKGNIDVIEDDFLKDIVELGVPEEYLTEVGLPNSIDDWKYNEIDGDMLKTSDVVVVVYIIEAQFYQSLDFFSDNDSYIVLELGDKKIKDKKRIDDNNNPKFFRSYRFNTILPGSGALEISFFDYDFIGRDELIGSTTIDIESRFFDRTWRAYSEHPIETRLLYHPTTSFARGSAKLWLDIFPICKEKPRIWDIDPRPACNLELRVIVWSVYDVTSEDFGGFSDLYVQTSLPSFDMTSKTDIHFAAKKGFGSFNWRNKFSITVDEYSKPEHFRIDFKIFDKDLLSSDDFNSNVTVDIYDLISRVLETEQKQSMLGPHLKNKNKSKIFCLRTIPKIVRAEGQAVGKKVNSAKIVVSIDCLTEKEALASVVGSGRSEPNHDPFLPEPKGRFDFSYDPFNHLEQYTGPITKTKICMCCMIFLLFLIIILFIPVFVPALIANILKK